MIQDSERELATYNAGWYSVGIDYCVRKWFISRAFKTLNYRALSSKLKQKETDKYSTYIRDIYFGYRARGMFAIARPNSGRIRVFAATVALAQVVPNDTSAT